MISGQLTSKKWFTILEIVVSLVLFAVIMIFAFDSLSNLGIIRAKTVSKVDLEKELYFFSEKLASMIKDGGLIDYDEYWNRKVIGIETASGHYLRQTGFGNYGSWGALWTTTYGGWYYYCRSGSGTSLMGTGWCLEGPNDLGNSVSFSGIYQRYGQYKYHFIDYNSNADGDYGDEDGVDWLIGDEDDVDIGDGPTIFSGWVQELYLYNSYSKTRTFFRWHITRDPDAPSSTSCNITTGVGDACIGNIEILKLSGKDYGQNHDGLTGSGIYDGFLDTWVCHPDWEWSCSSGPTAIGTQKIPTGSDAEWIPLFPSSVNVKNLQFFLYPNKDPLKAWSSDEESIFVHPHVRIELTLGLSWKKRKSLKSDDPKVSISTTLSLSEF